MLICSLRGFIGFAISFGTISFVDTVGYERSFNICAGIVGALMVLGLPVYLGGKRIRKWTQKYAVDGE